MADAIVNSRLLLLQSKRLLLTHSRARYLRTGDEQARIDSERLETDVFRAQARYNQAVLNWGSPDTPQYRLVVYTSLIAKAERLRAALSGAVPGLLFADRNEALEDLQNLDRVIAGWRSVARASMKTAVA